MVGTVSAQRGGNRQETSNHWARKVSYGGKKETDTHVTKEEKHVQYGTVAKEYSKAPATPIRKLFSFFFVLFFFLLSLSFFFY